METSGQSGSDEDLSEIFNNIPQAGLEKNSGLHTNPNPGLQRLLDQEVICTHNATYQKCYKGVGH